MYKFNIYFHKQLQSGGEKVVTYATLLRDPHAFGEDETPVGAIGHLSLTQDDRNISINALVQRYHSLLLGHTLSGIFHKEFPLCFTLDNELNIQAEVTDAEGRIHTFSSQNINTIGKNKFDLTEQDFPILIIPTKGLLYATCDTTTIDVEAGQLLLIPANENKIPLTTEGNVIVISLTKKDE